MKASHRPIVCKSGLVMSIQASEYHYCSPRNNKGPYSTVEIGYPSRFVADLIPFAEDKDNPTVYGNVPVEVVESIIAANGGIDLGKSL